ncbi:MAG TPA: hypothetical protein VGK51_13260 [Actinomycetota bacterium]
MEEEWERPQYEAGGRGASVLFVVFGPKPEPLRVTSLAHRVVPMELMLELEYQEPDVAAALLDSPSGATLLQGWEGEEPSVLAADGCMVMRAEVPDPKDLRYLRNCIGVATAILEAGGRAVANLQSLGMFTPESWRGVIFAPDKPQPRLHVNVFHDEEPPGAGSGQEGTVWLHSRGLRAFGRPDLSIRHVPLHAMAAASDLCNRLIETQAYGAVIPDGPLEGMIARTTGSLEDPDFDNVHIELAWPLGV